MGLIASLLSKCSGRRAPKFEAFGLEGSAVQKLYLAARALFIPTQISRLMRPEYNRGISEMLHSKTPLLALQRETGLPGFGHPNGESGLSILHEAFLTEMRCYLHNQLLRDCDVFGMANSLEIRVPLLDHQLVETVFQTAWDAILKKPQKSLLMNCLTSPLPRECINRPKMGFTFPFDIWMRGPWRRIIEEGLADLPSTPAGKMLEVDSVARVKEDFYAGRAHWSRLWSIYVLANWRPGAA